MEIRLNLATCSLKDAEHAIFIIGAYFGMTNLPHGPAVAAGCNTAVAATAAAPGIAAHDAYRDDAAKQSQPAALVPAPVVVAAPVEPQPDPAAVFGAGQVGGPVPLPPAAQELDPAAVFGGASGNAQPAAPAATVPAPVGTPAAQTPAPAVSAPPGVELDADGLPWDSRINAAGEGGTKPKNKDGRWRSKRGLNDAALVTRVQAELRATLAAPAPSSVVLPPSPPAQVPTPPAILPPPTPPAPAVAAPAAPIVPPAAVLPPAAPAAPSAPVAPTTFEQLMPRVTGAVNAGILPANALQQACTAYQLPNVTALATRGDVVPYVWAYMQKLYPNLV